MKNKSNNVLNIKDSLYRGILYYSMMHYIDNMKYLKLKYWSWSVEKFKIFIQYLIVNKLSL